MKRRNFIIVRALAILVIVLILLALAAAAVTAATRRATAIPILCPGTALAMDLSYDFNSADHLAESVNGQNSDRLAITAPYTAVTFDGHSAIFNNGGLLTAQPFADLNPGTRSFALCAMWKFGTGGDPDHAYNLVQINNNPGDNGVLGHVKMMPGYCLFIPSGGKTGVRAQVLTHGASAPGWHTESCIRRGDTFYSYLDGVLDEQVTVPGFGPIDLGPADRLCIGSKCTYGQPIHPQDQWYGPEAYVRFGVN